MLRHFAITITMLITLFCVSVVAAGHTLRLEDEMYVNVEELIEELKEAKVIFIGENHDNLYHHQAQQKIIHALREAGMDMVIGLEMFSANNQVVLDRWIKREIGFVEFKEAFLENWSWWDKYRQLFRYARKSRIPMVGLNLPRKISTKVSREGFHSLTEKERRFLPVVQCFSDDIYRDYIRRSLGRHDLKGKDFENFCEAQLLWDKVMAKNISDYLADNPKKKMVVLAGSGHAWKHGIPEQLKNKGEISWRVILPEAPGQMQRGSVNFNDVDYLLLGVEEESFH